MLKPNTEAQTRNNIVAVDRVNSSDSSIILPQAIRKTNKIHFQLADFAEIVVCAISAMDYPDLPEVGLRKKQITYLSPN